MTTPLDRRRAGVLLHPTSLPGGVLGEDARRFVDFLASAGFTVWQTLPLGPVDASLSPYQAKSAHAGSTALIDFAELAARGWLPDAMQGAGLQARLECVYRNFRDSAGAGEKAAFDNFVQQNRAWLLPYSLFEHHRRASGGRPWWEWPAPIRDREPAALTAALAAGRDGLRTIAFEQYLFDRQWQRLRDYANSRGVNLFGDLPFYVDLDSVEAWWHRKLFRIDADGRPEAVAGVPPDYFNADGQLWGNPLYAWEAMRADGYRWWVDRIRAQLRCFDLLRIDHFRGLESYWEVPAGATTAREGRWRAAPGDALLTALAADATLIAEDLGVITPAVEALRDRHALPGMRVLQFGFDGAATNLHLPHNYVANCVAYTGTHDNDTTLGWYRSLPEAARAQVHGYFACDGADMPEVLVRAVLQSVARLAILPLQDLLALDGSARMNTPGTVTGNWGWSFRWDEVPRELADHCRQMNTVYGRALTS